MEINLHHEAKEAWPGHRHRGSAVGIEQGHGFVRRGRIGRQRDSKLCETGKDGWIWGNTSLVQAFKIADSPHGRGREQLTHRNLLFSKQLSLSYAYNYITRDNAFYRI